jgi:hypothetical protein
MNDVLVVSLGMMMSLLCEACIKDTGMSILNIFLFINMVGLYYIIQKIHIEVKISLN